METIEIDCKNCFMFKVEIKKILTETVAKDPFLDLVPQIKPHPTSWQYPVINYFGIEQSRKMKESLGGFAWKGSRHNFPDLCNQIRLMEDVFQFQAQKLGQ